MTKIVSSFSVTAIILGVLLHAGAAQAVTLASRTWVSHTGNDANPCTTALPCATFATAYANTMAGGEIDVLDGGDFGILTISHALTVANDGAGTAAITPLVSSAAITITAASTDSIVLRGLNLNGANTQGPALLSAPAFRSLSTIAKFKIFTPTPG